MTITFQPHSLSSVTDKISKTDEYTEHCASIVQHDLQCYLNPHTEMLTEMLTIT